MASSLETPNAGRNAAYRIRVKGRLDREREAWFGDLSITTEDDGVTVLAGKIADQPALYGILERIRDLGLELISVEKIT